MFCFLGLDNLLENDMTVNLLENEMTVKSTKVTSSAMFVVLERFAHL